MHNTVHSKNFCNRRVSRIMYELPSNKSTKQEKNMQTQQSLSLVHEHLLRFRGYIQQRSIIEDFEVLKYLL